MIKVIKCKIGVVLSKWILVGKNVYIFMYELSLRVVGHIWKWKLLI